MVSLKGQCHEKIWHFIMRGAVFSALGSSAKLVYIFVILHKKEVVCYYTNLWLHLALHAFQFVNVYPVLAFYLTEL